MPTRPHTNTCNAVLSALENMRDLDPTELARQPSAVHTAHDKLVDWKRGEELDHITGSDRILDLGRQWADIYTWDGTAECDCDAKHVPVVARRWHRGHTTTAPARVLSRLTQDAYLVEFLTKGPGQPRQAAYRYAMAVSLDDVPFLDAMPITPQSDENVGE